MGKVTYFKSRGLPLSLVIGEASSWESVQRKGAINMKEDEGGSEV